MIATFGGYSPRFLLFRNTHEQIHITDMKLKKFYLIVEYSNFDKTNTINYGLGVLKKTWSHLLICIY